MKCMWMLSVSALVILTLPTSLSQFRSVVEQRKIILGNNSYIHYSNISDGDGALHCESDSVNCCNDSDVANWRDEKGRTVHQGVDEATCLYVTRRQGNVSLNRKDNCIPDTSGLWRCDIPDSSEVIQSHYIYISIDNTSGKPFL